MHAFTARTPADIGLNMSMVDASLLEADFM
jgi:hypothetical protein